MTTQNKFSQITSGMGNSHSLNDTVHTNKSHINILRLETSEGKIFEKICQWNYHWWGTRDGYSLDEVKYNMSHSLCTGSRMPQTFVAMSEGEPVGMYQISMSDDLPSRPDIYPWLINVYVEEKFRGKGVCRALMNTVADNAKRIGVSEIYLYTHHTGLYEKFNWKFVDLVPTFRKDSPLERLYRLKIE